MLEWTPCRLSTARFLRKRPQHKAPRLQELTSSLRSASGDKGYSRCPDESRRGTQPEPFPTLGAGLWWSLATSATVGFGAALAIHVGVAYTDFWPVAPIYAGILITVIALALARQYFLAVPARVQVPPSATGELNAARPS